MIRASAPGPRSCAERRSARGASCASAGVLTLVNVTKPAATATSQPASLIVDGSAVAIKRHPANAMIALGSSHTLSVVAIGPATPALAYQWLLNGKNIKSITIQPELRIRESSGPAKTKKLK